MRRLVLRLHLTVAAVAGVFLVILGLTGSIMAFEPELTHRLHPALWYVTPGAAPLPLATLAEAALRTVPGTAVTGYALSSSRDLSYQVYVRSHVIYVNQYTGAVLGVGASGPDFLGRVHQLHIRLLWTDRQDRGKSIMSWAGVALLFLGVSGLYLWWPTKRWRLREGPAARKWRDLHHVTGIVSLLFLVVLTVTGISIGFDTQIVPLAYRLTGTAPALMYAQTPLPHSAAQGRPMISPDAAVAAARQALPDATPISVNVPGPTGVYLISARYPEDRTPGGRSRVIVDPYSGAVLAAEGSRTAPAGSRLVTLNRAIHTGDVFGLASKTVMSLASLAVILQAVSGLVIWWGRRGR